MAVISYTREMLDKVSMLDMAVILDTRAVSIKWSVLDMAAILDMRATSEKGSMLDTAVILDTRAMLDTYGVKFLVVSPLQHAANNLDLVDFLLVSF